MDEIKQNPVSAAEHAMDEQTSQTVKALQLALLEILDEFERVCEKHGLKYVLVAGSLLGAVRHKGFIPWDDDLDIIMPRDDYERLREIAPKEFKDKFFFQDYTTDAEFPSIYAKVRNSESTMIEAGYRNLKKMNHGIFLDVFVADRYKECSKNNLRKKVIKICRNILLMQRVADTGKIQRLIASCFPSRALFKLVDKVSAKMDSEKGNDKYIMLNEYVMPDGIFDKIIDVPFENTTAKIPENYDDLLSDMFGDYMSLPPLEKRAPKHMTALFSVNVPYKEYIKENLK